MLVLYKPAGPLAHLIGRDLRPLCGAAIHPPAWDVTIYRVRLAPLCRRCERVRWARPTVDDPLVIGGTDAGLRPANRKALRGDQPPAE